MEHVTALVQPGGELALSPSNLLGGIVVSLSLMRAVMPSLDEALALVPHHTVFTPVATIPVPFFWNVVTAHFFEEHLLKVAIVAPGLVVLARMLERLWTARALAVHLGFTALCTGSAVFLAELFHVYRTHHLPDFFLPIRGGAGLLVALAVGLRHAYPLEALPLLPRSWGTQCQHLPFGITAFVVAASFVAPRGMMAEWLFAPFAFFFGWFHLRYIMWFPYAGTHGDHSSDFCFAALFPRPLRPFVSCASSVIYALGVAVAPGYVKLREADSDVGHSIVYDPTKGPRPPGPALDPAAVAGAPGSQEYNARRAKALRLLDDNISSLLAPVAGRPVSLGRAPNGDAPLPLSVEEVLQNFTHMTPAVGNSRHLSADDL